MQIIMAYALLTLYLLQNMCNRYQTITGIQSPYFKHSFYQQVEKIPLSMIDASDWVFFHKSIFSKKKPL